MTSLFNSQPKPSFSNIPLLIALLTTSILHILLILGIKSILPKHAENHHAVAIHLMKLQPAPKPQEVIPVPAPTEPAVLPVTDTPPIAVAENPPPQIPRKFAKHHSSRAQHTTFTPQTIPETIPVIVETERAVIEEPPVSVPEPSTPPVVIAKPTIEPAAPVIVEPKVSAPPAPVNSAPVPVNSTPAPEKIIAAPTKPAKKVAEKPSDKATSNNTVADENTAPALSMEDLALQIAQVGEKYGNQQPVPNETAEKKQPTTQNYKLLVRQYSADARHKVERIGNLNYPKSAWQKEFTEKSVIEAVIGADGGLQSIRVKKSSGDSAIDDAARNIVQMSAPFAAFPQKLAAELDSIKVTFPLRFSDESGISVR